METLSESKLIQTGFSLDKDFVVLLHMPDTALPFVLKNHLPMKGGNENVFHAKRVDNMEETYYFNNILVQTDIPNSCFGFIPANLIP